MNIRDAGKTTFLISAEDMSSHFGNTELLLQYGLGGAKPIDLFSLARDFAQFKLALPKALQGMAIQPGLIYLQSLNSQTAHDILAAYTCKLGELVDVSYLSPTNLTALPNNIRCSLSSNLEKVVLPNATAMEGSIFATNAREFVADHLVAATSIYLRAAHTIRTPNLEHGFIYTGARTGVNIDAPLLNQHHINPTNHTSTKTVATLHATCG